MHNMIQKKIDLGKSFYVQICLVDGEYLPLILLGSKSILHAPGVITYKYINALSPDLELEFISPLKSDYTIEFYLNYEGLFAYDGEIIDDAKFKDIIYSAIDSRTNDIVKLNKKLK